MRQGLYLSLWCLSLAVCPAATCVIGTAYTRDRSYLYDSKDWPPAEPPSPWPYGVVNGLMVTHLVLSAAAALAVFWLFDGWRTWLLAWLAVISVLPVAAFCWFAAAMATTGIYL